MLEIQQATFRLVDRDGDFAGTAFLVGGDGTLLTCHHVARHQPIQARDERGREWTTEWLTRDDAELERCDFALLRLNDWQQDEVRPLPLLTADPGKAFDTAVHLKDGEIFASSVPLSGSLQGIVSIRYQDEEQVYSPRAAVIRGLDVWPGMSGSAVWDPELQAVIGVISVHADMGQNIRGFAVPLVAATGSKKLVHLCAANDAEIARFGREPNRRAVRSLLKIASDQTVARLVARGLYDRETYVPREGVSEALAGFLASEATIFPIVSAAGQGKTSLLASLAEDGGETPSLLLRALDFPGTLSATEALTHIIEQAVTLPLGCDWRLLAKRSGRPLLLLLDGLNELGLPSYRIAQEWLPDLIDGLSATGWKAVVTMRRELAEELSLASLAGLYSPQTGEGRSQLFQLGQFSSNEAAEARLRYKLSSGLARSIGRQPLILRLASEGASGRNRHGILDRYVTGLLRDAGQYLPTRHPGELAAALRMIAEAASEQGESVLSFTDPVLADRELVQAFTNANVLERVQAGYRILFDEVAEFALAQSRAEAGGPLDLEAPVNVVSLAIETRAARDAAQALTEGQRLCTLGAGSLEGSLKAFRIAALLNGQSEFDIVKAMVVEAVVDNAQGIIRQEVDLPSRLPRAALSVLLTSAILREDGYGWREKDVWSDIHRQSTLNFSRLQIGLGRAINDLINDDSIDGASMLIEWLQDARPLSHSGRLGASFEATVGSYALCMLLAYREQVGLDKIFREVILKDLSGGRAILEALCADVPSDILDLLVKLACNDAVEHFEIYTLAWQHLLRKHSDLAAGPAQASLRDLWPLLSEAQLHSMLYLALAHGVEPDQAISEAFARWAVCGGDADLIVAAFQASLIDLPEALRIAHRHGSTYHLVWRMVGQWTPSANVALKELVQLIHTRDPAADGGWWEFENLLRQVTLLEARESALTDYVTALIGSGSSATNWAHVAFGRPPDEPEGARQFRSWLAELLMEAPQIHETGMRASALFAAAQVQGLGSKREGILELAREADIGELLSLALRTEERADYVAIVSHAIAGAIDRGEAPLGALDAWLERVSAGEDTMNLEYCLPEIFNRI